MHSLYVFLTVSVGFVIASHAEISNSQKWNQGNLETLQLVQVIMRHGDRNPIAPFPLDPNKDNPDYFPEGFGQLTNVGVKQTNNLGKFVRQRYDGFIGSTYHSDELYALSSDTERSIRSGNSFLRGLFPKSKASIRSSGESSLSSSILHSEDHCPEEEDDGENSQVVPIRTINKEIDNFLYLNHKCPRFDKEFKELIVKESINWMKDNGKTLLSVFTNAGIVPKGDGIHAAGHVFDYLNVLKYQNKPLPDWATPEVMSLGKQLFQSVFGLETATRSMKELRSAMVKKILENMQKKLDEPKEANRKIILYSGHDRTIVSFLNILGMFNNLIPYYASGVLIELHKSPELEEHHIELYFRNDTTVEPYKLDFELCGNPCLLSSFKKIVDDLVPEDFDKSCEL
ncbi:unnamed protein product [Allacma fusca]|uniref:acid phosphatase n=1 Tax=Allacma fusca TaxID=39272 RepID=A0A8J2LEQ7_9HEXA|nr:unnamed protein product [Allacma fusca]